MYASFFEFIIIVRLFWSFQSVTDFGV